MTNGDVLDQFLMTAASQGLNEFMEKRDAEI